MSEIAIAKLEQENAVEVHIHAWRDEIWNDLNDKQRLVLLDQIECLITATAHEAMRDVQRVRAELMAPRSLRCQSIP